MEIDRVNELDCDADTMLEFFLQESYKRRVNEYMDMYEEYYAGKSRVTFIGDAYVYKVPINSMGDLANFDELKQYKYNLTHPEDVYIPIAPCEFIRTDVLRMDKVEIPLDRFELTEKYPWVNHVDSLQVGYLSSGELVAYDL